MWRNRRSSFFFIAQPFLSRSGFGWQSHRGLAPRKIMPMAGVPVSRTVGSRRAITLETSLAVLGDDRRLSIN